MIEISEINIEKMKQLFTGKKEKLHKLDFLQQNWATVAQMMGYSNFEIDELATKYIKFFSSKREEFYPELIEKPFKGLMVNGDIGTGKTTNFKIYNKIYHKISIEVEGKIFPPLASVNDDKFIVIHVKEIERNLRIEGEEFIERLCRIKKLVIDDLGVEGDDFKDWGTSRNPVVDLINHRYNKMYHEGIVTHFTTNLVAKELRKKYGDRTTDRIKEMVIQVPIKGESKRV